jgi:hypothetical protein
MQLWVQEVIATWELEQHHVLTLVLAAESWDRATGARKVLDRDGTVFLDRFGQPKPRPEVQIEQASKVVFARLVRELALDVAAPDESRPPGLVGRKR